MTHAPSSTFAPMLHCELAGWRFVELLGEGGMAAVFRGVNLVDETVERAIKVVRPDRADREEFVARFREEVRILERLDHPNVVRFYTARQQDDLLLMELELLRGQTIGEYLDAAPGPVRAITALTWLEDAAAGVAAAHRLDIVHRDIKPDNLFITDDGPVKVLDFGIARAIDDADRRSKVTRAGTVPGSPAYLAPEICTGSLPTPAGDVYALGLTCFEALVGVHPFRGPDTEPKSSHQLMYAHVHEALPDLAALRPDLHHEIIRVLMRAVDKNVETRYRDAGAFLKALRKAMRLQPDTDPGVPISGIRIPRVMTARTETGLDADIAEPATRIQEPATRLTGRRPKRTATVTSERVSTGHSARSGRASQGALDALNGIPGSGDFSDDFGDGSDDDDWSPGQGRGKRFALIALFLLVAGASWFIFMPSSGSETPDPTTDAALTNAGPGDGADPSAEGTPGSSVAAGTDGSEADGVGPKVPNQKGATPKGATAKGATDDEIWAEALAGGADAGGHSSDTTTAESSDTSEAKAVPLKPEATDAMIRVILVSNPVARVREVDGPRSGTTPMAITWRKGTPPPKVRVAAQRHNSRTVTLNADLDGGNQVIRLKQKRVRLD